MKYAYDGRGIKAIWSDRHIYAPEWRQMEMIIGSPMPPHDTKMTDSQMWWLGVVMVPTIMGMRALPS